MSRHINKETHITGGHTNSNEDPRHTQKTTGIYHLFFTIITVFGPEYVLVSHEVG